MDVCDARTRPTLVGRWPWHPTSNHIVRRAPCKRIPAGRQRVAQRLPYGPWPTPASTLDSSLCNSFTSRDSRGTRLKTRRGSSLYDFWGDRISKQLNADAEGHADPTLVNLASQEYFGAVDAKALKLPVVTCHFKEEKGNELRVLGFFAKRARGRMARYVIDNRIDRAEGLKGFDLDGYGFRADLSTDADWVFARLQP